MIDERFAAALLGRLDMPIAVPDEPVVALASLICTPPFVPFPLLRDIRSQCLPGSTFGLEGRLCESAFVESVSSDGFALEPKATINLRRALRGVLLSDDFEVDQAGFRSAMGAGLEYLSPLLRVEERIVWAYVTTEDAKAEAEHEFAVVVECVLREQRMRMLEWASAAMRRLPEETLAVPSAWILSQLCRAMGLPYPNLELPEGALDYRAFRPPFTQIPEMIVGIARDGRELAVGPVSYERPIGIVVPRTVPAIVRVSWDEWPDGVELSGIERDVQTAPTGRSAVNLISLDGRVVRLGPITGDTPPEVTEAAQVFDRLEGAYRAHQTMRAEILNVDLAAAGHLVRLSDEPSIQAFLPDRHSALPRLPATTLGSLMPQTIQVQITHVDRENQRVTVRRIRALRSRGNLVEGRLYKGRVVAKQLNSILVSLNEAAGLEGPEYEPLIGSISVNRLLPVHNWDKKLRSARSYPVQIGDEVDVTIESISPGNKEVKLAMAGADPVTRRSLPAGVKGGDRLIGTVTEKHYHGIRFALVGRSDGAGEAGQLPPSLTGTVVNTELSWEGRYYFGWGDARDFPLEVGDQQEVLVTGINRVTGEVDLSIKRLSTDPAEAAIKLLRPGTIVPAVIRGRRGNQWRVRLEPWSIAGTMTVKSPPQGQLETGTWVLVRIEQINLGKRMVRSSLREIIESPYGSVEEI
jgi:ribosomal protein S1